MSAPQSLFGAVPITLLREGAPVDWKPNLQTVTFHFPGGDVTETQVLGQAELEVEYLVRLDSDTDFQALYALYSVGSRQTMRMPRRTTAFGADREFQEHGELYKEYDSVQLGSLTDVQPRNGGTVLCRCTFQRGAP